MEKKYFIPETRDLEHIADKWKQEGGFATMALSHQRFPFPFRMQLINELREPADINWVIIQAHKFYYSDEPQRVVVDLNTLYGVELYRKSDASGKSIEIKIRYKDEE